MVILRKAMMSKEAAYTITVDNVTSREDVTRYGEHQGYKAAVTEENGEYTLTFTKG